MTTEPQAPIAGFITRWTASGAAERANYQLFLSELCDALTMPRPEPSRDRDALNEYVFERAVVFDNGDGTTTTKFIDLYKRGCFVLEAKQGSEKSAEKSDDKPKTKSKRGTAVRGTKGWDAAMLKAKGQAEQYLRNLPKEEPTPPFLIVVDVGHSIELYADFSRSGRTYLPFPDARSFRLLLDDLLKEEQRDKLRLVWTEPLTLDPSRRSARVTRTVAARLATLAKSLEESGHAPEAVAAFLMRAIFTMFAEDVQLIPERGFTELLESLRDNAAIFPQMVESLWRDMNSGGFSPILKQTVLRFNGGLFEKTAALPLTKEQLDLLLEASRADWHDVEPAIFGTLLERALDPVERHKLGAHYTPRAYVERLVMPTIIEPLRDEWQAVQVAAVQLANEGKLDDAAETVKQFHRHLCAVQVLDPACGSGNFLYVTLEHLKRLEGEVLNQLEEFKAGQMIFEREFTVDPHQLLGIEVNPRAAAIADLVLWIGYLQWHFRTRGDAMPPEPVLKKFHNIECRDAALAYDGVEPVTDGEGQAVTRWDGRTYKKHPVTGEAVPDETARVAVLKYLNPRKAEWQAADYIIGNPPFIGNKRMRLTLGDGYTEALRQTYSEVPESSDFVMYWWENAAKIAREGKIKRFGLIATNSLPQAFNRRVLQSHLEAKNPLSLVFAIPDHPWVDSTEGAAVRISMTVCQAGEYTGLLQQVLQELQGNDESSEVEFGECRGKIFADLTIGADIVSALPLKANEILCCKGVTLVGSGFIVTSQEAEKLGLGRIEGLEKHIRHYRNGRDIAGNSRNAKVIDLFGLPIDEVQSRFPEVYQWIYERVKPERAQNKRESYKINWWIFGEPRKDFRPVLIGLSRYVSTIETSKHRFFVFLDKSILPDQMLVNIALDDAFYLGVLSSRIHVSWALAAGGTLEDRPRYNKTRCFDTFPFPDCDEQQKATIRELGERLDAHRKRQQALHPTLTITDMYNVLERLRAAQPLTDKERVIHEQGLISVLKQLHDDLDTAVFAAYGWSASLTDAEILERLVALNRERADEERRGTIRWLRPDYQNRQAPTQTNLGIETEPSDTTTPAAKAERLDFPKGLAEQARVVRNALMSETVAITAAQLATKFKARKNLADRISELLQTLVLLGQAREVEAGKYLA